MADQENKKELSIKKLTVQVIIKYIFSLLILIVLLFLPAGTFKFWNAWIFLGGLFIPMVFVMIYLLVKDPALLAKRMQMKEKEKTQKIYVSFSLIFFFVLYLIPGFDYKYRWSHVPVWLVLISTVFMLGGYLLFFIVMRQNSYASRIIEIQQGQKLIDTGLYSVVRHPMYLAAIIIFSFSALVLGSYYMLIFEVLFQFLLVFRILNEEKLLRKNLTGYEVYMRKVKYRLIPFIW